MNFLDQKHRLVFAAKPRADKVDFIHIFTPERNKHIIQGLSFALIIMIAVCLISFPSGFGIMVDGENVTTLFSLIAATALWSSYLVWVLIWVFSTLGLTYVLLFLLFGKQVLIVSDGKVEAREELGFICFATQAPATKEIAKALLRRIKKGKKNAQITSEFNDQHLAELKSALALNEAKGAERYNLSELVEIRNSDSEKNQYVDIGENASNSHKQLPFWALIIANLFPVLGAWVFDWRLGEVLVIYWAETMIIVFYLMLKNLVLAPIANLVFTVFIGGIFTFSSMVSLLFIWFLFVEKDLAFDGASGPASLSTAVSYFISLWPALVVTFVSHGVSFYTNFFKTPQENQENQENLTIDTLLKRISTTFYAILLGSLFIYTIGSSSITVILLILIKTVVDAKQYSKYHG